MPTVHFTFEDTSLTPVSHPAEIGDSVLEVALKHGIELHHNCGGVCACSTCHVYIEQGEDDLPEVTEKEEDFIDRAINPRLNSRLGCQSEILTEDAEIKVRIPDQSQFLGH